MRMLLAALAITAAPLAAAWAQATTALPGGGTAGASVVYCPSPTDPTKAIACTFGGAGGGGATAANQNATAPGTSAANAQGVQGVVGGVALPTKPGPYTIVPLRTATITTGGTAVTALNAGDATGGGKMVTANAAGMCIDQSTTAGTVTGTPSTTICVAQNQPFKLTPSAAAVSANSTASGVALAGNGLQ